jgi:hypothetical protein
MYPSDEDPTSVMPAVVPRRPLGQRWRVAAIGVAAVLIAAGGAGIGMAVIGGGPTDDMTGGMTSHVAVAKTGNGDPSRQAWAHQYGQDRSQMPNLPDVTSASPQQQAAAADLLARTEAATAAYADPAKAQAAGYDLSASLSRAEQKDPKLATRLGRVDSGAHLAHMPMLHVANKANRHDGKVLDPSAPETLMYEYQGHNAWKLVGVMYTANESYPQAPPDPGGPITRWHYHDKGGGAALMMHIFFVPGNDLSHAYALTMEPM